MSLYVRFSTAVPFYGQTTWNLAGLSPKHDCGPKRVGSPVSGTKHLEFDRFFRKRTAEFPLGLRSCFGDKTLVIRVVCPRNGTAVLEGLRMV